MSLLPPPACPVPLLKKCPEAPQAVITAHPYYSIIWHTPPPLLTLNTADTTRRRPVTTTGSSSRMARGTRKTFKRAVPLTFFAIPAAGGALAFGLPPSCARDGTTSSLSAALQGQCGHGLQESGSRPTDAFYSRRTLRRARGDQVGSAVQVMFALTRCPSPVAVSLAQHGALPFLRLLLWVLRALAKTEMI